MNAVDAMDVVLLVLRVQDVLVVVTQAVLVVVLAYVLVLQDPV